MRRLFPAVILLLLLPAAAFAHGDTPLPTDLTSVDDSQWVLRTNFGLLTSDAPDRYVCEEAFAGGDDFQVGVLGLNEWLIYTHDAVLYSPDGCDFEIRQEIPRKPAGVAVSPDRSRAAYLINVEDAAETGVWWTEDAAETVEQAGLDTSTMHLSRAAFLDQSRLLVSAYSSADANRGEARLVVANLDDGTTSQLEGLDGLSYPYVLDVRSDWLVWLARDDSGQKIFWGPLDEPTRHSKAVESWPSGAELGEDGQTVWVSGVHTEARGVLVGDASAEPVWTNKLVDHSADCVGYVDGAYHLCARRDREGHDLSRVGADGSLQAVVDFSQLAGPRQDCPADSDVATTCPAVWPELATALDIEVEGAGGDTGADAGSDAGADAGGGDGSGGDSGGCSTAGGSSPVAWFVVAGFAVLFAARQRWKA